MMPQGDTDYKKLFSQLIKKQMLVLGPDITLAKVKNVPGLSVDNQGEVQNLQGDPQAMLQALINQFVELSGMIVKKTMESILTSYPGMMGLAATPIMGGVAVSQPQITADTSSQAPIAPTPAVTPVAPTAPEKPKEEPPSMTSMSLESLSSPSLPKTEEKSEPKSFTQDEMASLNKALEELSKAPLSTENTPQQSQTPQ